jgi:hypothetical protein
MKSNGTYLVIITLLILVFAGAYVMANESIESIKVAPASTDLFEEVEEVIEEEIEDIEDLLRDALEGVDDEEELVEIIEPTPTPTRTPVQVESNGMKFNTPSACIRCTPDTIPAFGTVCPAPCKNVFAPDYWNVPEVLFDEFDIGADLQKAIAKGLTTSPITGLTMGEIVIDPYVSPLSGIRVGDVNQMNTLINRPEDFKSAYKSGYSGNDPNGALFARFGWIKP